VVSIVVVVVDWGGGEGKTKKNEERNDVANTGNQGNREAPVVLMVTLY
jgi:hypothetical protein